METQKRLGGNTLLFLASLVWGFAFVAQSVAGRTMSAFSIGAVRFLFGGVFLTAVLAVYEKIRGGERLLLSRRNRCFVDLTRAELAGGACLGITLATATTLQQVGINLTSSGKASFLTALYVVFVPLLGILRRKIAPLHVWVSIGVAVVGAYLLASCTSMGGFGWGDALLLTSAFCFAVQIVLIDLFTRRADGVRLAIVEFYVAGTVSLICSLFGPLPTWGDLAPALPSLAYLAILSGGFAYTAQIVGQKLSGMPTVASLIMSLESVFGAVGGALLLDEAMSDRQIWGCAVILFAVVLSQLPLDVWWRRVMRQKKKKEEREV